MNPSSILNMTAPCREDFEIPFHEVGEASQKLALSLVAGIHGNELNGVFVLARLADYLRGVAAGKSPGLTLTKRVLIIPAVNVLGLNLRMRLWPFDKTDINRMFPGYDQGETTQRIAASVLSSTCKTHYRIDLHSSNLDIEEMPHLRLFEPSETEREHGKSFGLPILEKQIDPITTVSLIHAWKNFPGENFSVRGGKAGELQLDHCEKIFHALLQFLNSTGILQGELQLGFEQELHYFSSQQSFRLISDQAGFFVSKMEVGRWIHASDLLGVLYDGYTGKIRAEIKSPKSGLLLALRRQPLVFQGDLIARILLK